MTVSREEKKIEAIARMKMWGIFPETVKQFKNDDLISESIPPVGACFWIEGEQLERLRRFEKENNALVYFVIHSYTNIGGLENYIGTMTIEVDELRRQLSGALDEYISGMTFSVGTLCGVPVVVAQSGVGKVAAAVCMQTMIQHFRVDAIINTGVAATLTDFLGIGDVAIADDVVQHDVDTTVFGSPPGHLSDLGEAYMPTDTVLTALVSDEAQKLGVRQAIGTIASGDQFLADKQRKDWIHKTFGAIAGEMEAGSIGQVCRLNRIPVAVIRVISDGAGGSPAEEYDAFVGQAAARSGQLVLATLKRLKASGSYLCGNGREFFGAVSWCREDIENALEVCEVTPSAAAVSAVTQFCKSSHFVERMVERGWDEMYGFINEHAKDWEEAEDNAN